MWDWNRTQPHAFVGAAVTTLRALLAAREASPLSLLNSRARDEARKAGLTYRDSGAIFVSAESAVLP